MNLEKAVVRFAGTMVLLSAILTYFYGLGWLLLTGFVGLNMLQATFTGFCPLAMILKKVGFKSGGIFS